MLLIWDSISLDLTSHFILLLPSWSTTVRTVQLLIYSMVTQKVQWVTDVLSVIFYLNPQRKPRSVSGSDGSAMIVGLLGNVIMEAWRSDAGFNVKDRMPPLIRWWVTGGRKQIMLSFNSILFWACGSLTFCPLTPVFAFPQVQSSTSFHTY